MSYIEVNENERADIGSKVFVDFVGTLTDGTEFDSSAKRGGSLELVIGSQVMPPAFERALCQMQCGERKVVDLSAAEAFGEHDENLVMNIPLANLPTPEKAQPGTRLLVNGPFGYVQIKILNVEGDFALVDFNHELAGKDIRYDITLVSIIHESAIEQESHAEGCSCGCHALKESIEAGKTTN